MNKFETEFLPEWLSDMQTNSYIYQEPIVQQYTRNLVKIACKTLNQDIHVFVMSIDILEVYIQKKNEIKEVIEDPALVLVTIIFISSKHMGHQDLKVPYIAAYLKKIGGNSYDYRTIKLQEMEILYTLDNNLPIFNRVDDLKSFLVQIEKDMKIKVSMLPLCLELLELLYLTQPKWFLELKSIYSISDLDLDVFKNLMRNRIFLPVGILAYVFQHTAYKNSLQIDVILEDLANRYNLNIDHINTLVNIIKNIVDN